MSGVVPEARPRSRAAEALDALVGLGPSDVARMNHEEHRKLLALLQRALAAVEKGTELEQRLLAQSRMVNRVVAVLAARRERGAG